MFPKQDPIEGMRRASRETDYVFLTDESFYETVMGTEQESLPLKCELVTAQQQFMHVMYGFPFQKGSPYLAHFNER